MTPFAQTMYTKMAKVRPVFSMIDRHVAVLNIVSLALVALLCVFYIAQVNNTATKGYTIRELETRIKELSMHNQQLEVESHKVQALENVSNSVKMLGLVPAEMPTYVQGGTPSYALAK